MKRVLKSSLVCVICLNLILFSCLSVLADEHGGISGSFDGNLWTSDHWSVCFPNVEDFPDDNSLRLFTDHLEQFSSDEFQIMVVSPSASSSVGISDMLYLCECFGNAQNETGFYLTYPDNYQDNHTDMGKYYSYFSTNPTWIIRDLTITSGHYFYSIALSNFIGPGYKCICNSLEWYN